MDTVQAVSPSSEEGVRVRSVEEEDLVSGVACSELRVGAPVGRDTRDAGEAWHAHHPTLGHHNHVQDHVQGHHILICLLDCGFWFVALRCSALEGLGKVL